jgi:hypothetical protein
VKTFINGGEEEMFHRSRNNLNQIFPRETKLFTSGYVLQDKKNALISGLLIQEKALEAARALNFGGFKASNGWLHKFKTCHNILCKTICGELADAPKETADLWKEKLYRLCDGYSTCHPDIRLTNIHLSFLPPNTSSVCQLLDLGVIKAQYLKKLLRHILANLDNASSLSELTKRVTVLDAVSWMISAQNAIEPAVVTKCFSKAGFGMASSSISLTPDEDVDTTCLNDIIRRVLNDDITTDQLISFDDHVEISNTETDIARIVASRSIVDDEEEGELEIPEAYKM